MAMLRSASEMKDSGIEWVGQIPTDWHISKLKYLGTYINGFAFKPSDWSGKGKPIIRIQDLTGSNSGEPNFYEGDLDEKYLVVSGDILVSWAATLDAYVWKNGEGWLNQHIFKAIPVHHINKHYYLWLLKVAMGNMNNDNKHGIVMQHVTTSVFNNYLIPLAPLNIQDQIAVYLDDRCSKIDEIIVEATVSIEEYKKLKQAVIAEAVLYGLDRDVLKTNTGANWCPTIPSHWRFECGRHLFKETNIRSIDGSEELLTVSQYTGITPRSMKNVTMFEATSLVDYKICDIGDIAANTMWMWAGAVGVSGYYGVISPSYNTYRQKKYDYNSRYLDYLLRAFPLVNEYESLSTGIRASRLRLYPSQFLSIQFPVPPMYEQQEIVDFLDARVGDIDALISEKQALIDDLQAYKKSLIYEVVTGKRRVV